MRAISQVSRPMLQRRSTIGLMRSLATAAAPAGRVGGFTAAQLGDMAVKGIRPEEVKAEKQYTTLPMVEESLVHVTLIDFKGDQFKIVGKVGETLMKAAARYGHSVPLEDDSSGGGETHQVRRSERWVEDQYGEGPASWSSHVVVPKEWIGKIPPPMWGEKEILDLIDREDITPTSRLATEIRLTKDLDGMTVYVPDPPPSDDVMQTLTL